MNMSMKRQPTNETVRILIDDLELLKPTTKMAKPMSPKGAKFPANAPLNKPSALSRSSFRSSSNSSESTAPLLPYPIVIPLDDYELQDSEKFNSDSRCISPASDTLGGCDEKHIPDFSTLVYSQQGAGASFPTVAKEEKPKRRRRRHRRSRNGALSKDEFAALKLRRCRHRRSRNRALSEDEFAAIMSDMRK